MNPSLVRALVASFLCTGCLASPGCSAATPDNASPDVPAYLAVSCDGKCDGWGSIESLWQDASSLSHARSRIATQLFDELVRRAGGLDLPPEQLVIYGLLGMTPAAQTDVRLNVDMDFSTTWALDNAHFQAAGQGPFDAYARGREVQPIDGGLFDLDSLANLQ